ncbi:MAG: hypothetical protein WA003_08620 [Desulfuromonadaceae bacterium]
MTKAQWDAVEKSLTHQYAKVVLICDGFSLQLGIRKIAEMKLAIAFSVNGRGDYVEWMKTDCEERRRFFRPYTRSVWSKPQLDMMKKMTKKQLQNRSLDPGKTFTTYYPWWTSFKTLKSHLIKNNTSIELAPEV